MRVDDDFRNYIENIHNSFKNQYGIDVPYTKITKMATDTLKEYDFEKNAKSILVNKRRRRQIIIDL